MKIWFNLNKYVDKLDYIYFKCIMPSRKSRKLNGQLDGICMKCNENSKNKTTKKPDFLLKNDCYMKR